MLSRLFAVLLKKQMFNISTFTVSRVKPLPGWLLAPLTGVASSKPRPRTLGLGGAQSLACPCFKLPNRSRMHFLFLLQFCGSRRRQNGQISIRAQSQWRQQGEGPDIPRIWAHSTSSFWRKDRPRLTATIWDANPGTSATRRENVGQGTSHPRTWITQVLRKT